MVARVQWCARLRLYAPMLLALGAVAPCCAPAPDAADSPSRVTGRAFRIALVSDPHTTRGTQDDQPLYRGRFEQVIAEVNAAGVDLVLIAGDLTQSGGPEEVADFMSLIRRFRAPVRCVYGNHDVGGKHMPGETGGITAERLASVEKKLGPSFWKFERSGLRALGINASLLGSGLKEEQDQWAFLERELASPSALPTILLLHYPLFTESPAEAGGAYWNVEPGPRQRLLGLLRRGAVRAVLSGHLHHPLVLATDGILCYSAPPVSFGLPRDRQPEGWALVRVAQDGAIVVQPNYLPRGTTPLSPR